MQFQLIKDPIIGLDSAKVVKIIDDNSLISVIPTDPANSDYVLYLSWLASGNSPLASI